jgi:pyruvate kinase
VRRTKIVATLGPATSTPEMIEGLIRSGVDVARLNFSHGEHEDHARSAELIRKFAREMGRNVAILQDIQGPKIRVGNVVGGTELVPGNRVTIAPGDFLGDASRLPVSYEGIAQDVREGHRILIDDGLLDLKVVRVGENELECEVITGGLVLSHKGLNFPDSSLSIRGLTPKDIEDLEFGVREIGADWVAMSFVRSGDEILDLKDRIRRFGGKTPVVAKIEKHEAVGDIERIIRAADGIMVARGDLGIELPAEQVPIEQKRIVARSRRAGKPVIIATQMLDSMIRNPRPTRAEVSDVANAIFDRADAVMLSGETAVGRYPLRSVQEMDRICRTAESAIAYGQDLAASTAWGRGDKYDALTHAACELAEDLAAEAIITSTQSGLSCIRVARFRPSNRIIAVSPEESTVRMLALVWGVDAISGEQVGNMEARVRMSIEAAEGAGFVRKGDRVIITGGVLNTTPGSTNMLQVYTIGEE